MAKELRLTLLNTNINRTDLLNCSDTQKPKLHRIHMPDVLLTKVKNEGKLDKAATIYIHLGWFRVFGVSYKADVRGQYLSKSRSGCINIEHKTYVNLAHKQINLRYSTERRYLNRVSLREQFPSYILEWGDHVSSLLLS